MSTTAGVHPRLYFSADELAQLREQAKQGVRAQTLRRIVNWCERILDPADENYFDYPDFTHPRWKTRKSIFVVRPSLLSLSFVYAFTGERRYGEAARDAVLGLIEHKLADVESVSYGVHTPGWRRSIGHDKSIYAWSICTVYDLCYDLFSANQRRTFIEHALECIDILPYDSPVFLGDMSQMINNRGARGQIGPFGYFPLVLEGDVEIPRKNEHIAQAIASAEAYLHVTFDQDGVCFDGPGYAQVLDQIYFFCHMLVRSGRINLLRSRRWENFLHHLVHEMLPGGYTLNNLNDCDVPCGSVAPALYLMGTERGAVIPWLAGQLDFHPRRLEQAENNLMNAIVGANSPAILLNWKEDLPMRSPQELGYPISRYFPQRGIASMRTGWNEQDMLLSHRCGREMWRLHKQSDQNHLVFYALGERFLIDEGYGQPQESLMNDGSQFINRYFGCADVHNTVLLDGRDQNGNAITPGWAEGRIIDWRHTPDYDTTLGDAAECYGADHAIDGALRRVVFVRNSTHPFAIVIDTISAGDDASHDYEALWRTAGDNSIEVEGQQFRIAGEKNDCYGEVLFPLDAQLQARVHFNRPQLRVTARGPHLEMVTVLAPVRRGEEPPRFSLERCDEDDFLIRIHDGKVQHTICAGTRTTWPLRTPVPVRYNRE